MSSTGMVCRDRVSLPIVAFASLIIAAIVLYLSKGNADPDLWGHVKFGLDILDHGSIMKRDPYSYTAHGAVWINHEWLAEVLFAQAYRLMSVLGLQCVRMSMVIVCFVFVVARLLTSNCSKIIAVLLVALVAGLSTTAGLGFVQIRPQMFTFAAFACELFILQMAHEQGKRWILALLPPLFALWANLHGGFLAGLVVLYVWLFLRIVRSFVNRNGLSLSLSPHAMDSSNNQPAVRTIIGCEWPWVAAAVLSTLACLINPYGIGLITFLLHTATGARPEIKDWHPLHVVSFSGALYLIFGALLFTLSKPIWREDPVKALIILLVMILPFKAERHMTLAAVGAAMLAAPHLTLPFDKDHKLYSLLADKQLNASWRNLVSIALAAGTVLLVALSVPNLKTLLAPDMPAGAVYFLHEIGASGNVACRFGWGEYCIWHLYPHCLVSMDGRRETVYSDQIYDQSLRLSYGKWPWNDLLTKEPTDIVIDQKWMPAYSLLRLQPDWRLVYDDGLATIFMRRDSANIRLLPSQALPAPQRDLNIFP